MEYFHVRLCPLQHGAVSLFAVSKYWETFLVTNTLRNFRQVFPISSAFFFNLCLREDLVACLKKYCISVVVLISSIIYWLLVKNTKGCAPWGADLFLLRSTASGTAQAKRQRCPAALVWAPARWRPWQVRRELWDVTVSPCPNAAEIHLWTSATAAVFYVMRAGTV